MECHGAGKPMADLDVRAPASLLKGSRSGSVVAEGKSDSSVLVRKVVSHAMPPAGAGKPLSAHEVRVLREWIDRGHLFDGLEMTNSIDRPFTDAERLRLRLNNARSGRSASRWPERRRKCVGRRGYARRLTRNLRRAAELNEPAVRTLAEEQLKSLGNPAKTLR